MIILIASTTTYKLVWSLLSIYLKALLIERLSRRQNKKWTCPKEWKNWISITSLVQQLKEYCIHYTTVFCCSGLGHYWPGGYRGWMQSDKKKDWPPSSPYLVHSQFGDISGNRLDFIRFSEYIFVIINFLTFRQRDQFWLAFLWLKIVDVV